MLPLSGEDAACSRCISVLLNSCTVVVPSAHSQRRLGCYLIIKKAVASSRESLAWLLRTLDTSRHTEFECDNYNHHSWHVSLLKCFSAVRKFSARMQVAF
mmetsp:Transcript_27510/g.43699  ORF Transcript_27510/g.43699 Transcript_27510/m.43699 type:complete len:100 (-) Transcript_27510:19-318(-)